MCFDTQPNRLTFIPSTSTKSYGHYFSTVILNFSSAQGFITVFRFVFIDLENFARGYEYTLPHGGTKMYIKWKDMCGLAAWKIKDYDEKRLSISLGYVGHKKIFFECESLTINCQVVLRRKFINYSSLYYWIRKCLIELSPNPIKWILHQASPLKPA